jgi:hypothetical protein
MGDGESTDVMPGEGRQEHGLLSRGAAAVGISQLAAAADSTAIHRRGPLDLWLSMQEESATHRRLADGVATAAASLLGEMRRTATSRLRRPVREQTGSGPFTLHLANRSSLLQVLVFSRCTQSTDGEELRCQNAREWTAARCQSARGCVRPMAATRAPAPHRVASSERSWWMLALSPPRCGQRAASRGPGSTAAVAPRTGTIRPLQCVRRLRVG